MKTNKLFKTARLDGFGGYGGEDDNTHEPE